MTTHARLGASTAKRWMTCSASVEATKNLPDRPSAYAAEGTAAHALAAWCLEHDTDAVDYLDKVFEGYVVTEAMADAVQLYLDTVRESLQDGDVLLVEKRFSLAKLNPPAEMFGTADAVIYKPRWGHLIVIDLKFGAGVAVDAVGNAQGRYYGLGACLAFEGQPIRTVEVVIVQPRASHRLGPIRRETISAFDLIEWAGELFDMARKALSTDTTFVAGDHCKFCPAAPTCPALRQAAIDGVGAYYDGGALQTEPPSPQTLSAAEIGLLLDAAETLDLWLKALRGEAFALLGKGVEIPGFKLVSKRGRRKWTLGERETISRLMTELDFAEDEIFARKLKSPAQIERGQPKAVRSLLATLQTKAPGSPTLARTDDPRPALQGAALLFPDDLEDE